MSYQRTHISEVFASVQGEGQYIGCRQVFIRIAGCIFGCPYCDTDYSASGAVPVGEYVLINPVASDVLADAVLRSFDPRFIHSYSFTGGEPLLSADFVEECASILKSHSGRKLFLETSGLIPEQLQRFDGIFDIMSIDIKTHSDKVLENMPVLFKTAAGLKKSEYYFKLLLPENFGRELLYKVIEQMLYWGINDIIIQPVDNRINEEDINFLFSAFYEKGISARLIPQSHKLLGIR